MKKKIVHLNLAGLCYICRLFKDRKIKEEQLLGENALKIWTLHDLIFSFDSIFRINLDNRMLQILILRIVSDKNRTYNR